MTIKKIKFTKEGFEELNAEYTKLKSDRISAVMELQRAREMGDLSENAAYKVARSKLSSIDARIRRIEKIFRFSIVVEKNNSEYIDIGSKVVINNGINTKEILLVDGWESDFTKGKISIYSPIGKALRRKKTGDVVYVITPAGEQKYKIESVT